MDGIGDAIGLDYFEGLPPDLREAVRQCRRDLRTLGPDNENIKRRTAGRDEVRQRLAATATATT